MKLQCALGRHNPAESVIFGWVLPADMKIGEASGRTIADPPELIGMNQCRHCAHVALQRGINAPSATALDAMFNRASTGQPENGTER